MNNQIRYYWNLYDQAKMYYNMVLMVQGRINPREVLYNSLRNEILKRIIGI